MTSLLAKTGSAPDLSMTRPEKFRILKVPVSVVTMPVAVETISRAARGPSAEFVLVREVPSLMLSADSSALLKIHRDALLVVPDGMPLVWVGRTMGHGKDIGRVAGADLVDALCAKSLDTGQSHYFYGGMPGVAAEMARRLSERYPGLRVAGVYSPPMRAIDETFAAEGDVRAEISEIRATGADFIWVGISSPKQEFWMAAAAPLLGHGVCIGVGAAFNFHSGAIVRAPRIMRDYGFEWLHRLISEPKRLWHRYLVLAPQFVARGLSEVMAFHLKRLFSPNSRS